VGDPVVVRSLPGARPPKPNPISELRLINLTVQCIRVIFVTKTKIKTKMIPFRFIKTAISFSKNENEIKNKNDFIKYEQKTNTRMNTGTKNVSI